MRLPEAGVTFRYHTHSRGIGRIVVPGAVHAELTGSGVPAALRGWLHLGNDRTSNNNFKLRKC